MFDAFVEGSSGGGDRDDVSSLVFWIAVGSLLGWAAIALFVAAPSLVLWWCLVGVWPWG